MIVFAALLLDIVFIVVPLCLVFCFDDKFRGFLYVAIGWILFQILSGLITQFFGIFSYSVVTCINLVAAAGCTFAFAGSFKKTRPANADSSVRPLNHSFKIFLKKYWVCIIALAIVFFELFSVHYFYTGIVSTINGFATVSESSYRYPLFSDEYAGVAFTQYSIRSHSLPLVDPLDNNAPYENLLLVFFSFTAEILLLFGLHPLTGYAILALGTGMTICFLIFLYLRQNKVSVFASSFAVMTVPLIINGANLPGVWFYLPFILGFIVFLLGLMSLGLEHKSEHDEKILSERNCLFFAASLISLIIYPALFVFIAPAVLVVLWGKRSISAGLIYILTAILAFILIGAAAFFTIPFVKFGVQLILRNNQVGGIPSFPIWHIVPIFVLALALVGIWVFIRSKEPGSKESHPKESHRALLASLATGLVFWIAYAYTTNVIIIDYPRVVIITALLLIICAGFGFDFLIRKIEVKKYHAWILPLEILVCLVFMFFSTSYPLDTWGSLVLRIQTPTGIQTVDPASPISRYLVPDDLRLFSGITGKTFIAPSWKGLVIGAATGNYPLDSKASTLTESRYLYSTFMTLDCTEKTLVAEHMHIDYAYASAFSCPDFTPIGTSSEGIVLYTFTGNM